MAASTKQFTLTSSAYQDVSEGASAIWFEVPFNRNQDNGVRIHLGQTLPAADITNYFLGKPSRPIGNEDKPEDYPVDISGLATTDRVYVRMDQSVSLSITVFRI